MLPDAPRKKAQLLSLPFEAFRVQPLPDSASLCAMRSPPPASGPLTERGPVRTSRPGWLSSCLHSASLTPRPQGSPPDSRCPPCPSPPLSSLALTAGGGGAQESSHMNPDFFPARSRPAQTVNPEQPGPVSRQRGEALTSM